MFRVRSLQGAVASAAPNSILIKHCATDKALPLRWLEKHPTASGPSHACLDWACPHCSLMGPTYPFLGMEPPMRDYGNEKTTPTKMHCGSRIIKMLLRCGVTVRYVHILRNWGGWLAIPQVAPGGFSLSAAVAFGDNPLGNDAPLATFTDKGMQFISVASTSHIITPCRQPRPLFIQNGQES